MPKESKRSFENDVLILAIVLFVSICMNWLVVFSHTPPLTGQAVGAVDVAVVLACNAPLVQGWNLISVCANISNTSIQSALSSINSDYRYVMEWNESSQEFMVYSPRSMSPPFSNLNLSKSYFVLYLPNATTALNFNGTEFNDTNLSLIYGWDTPTYPYIFTGNVTKYLNTMANKYRYMMKWNASNQEFVVYSPRAAVNPFYTIGGGEGQFILISDALGALLRYNKTDVHA